MTVVSSAEGSRVTSRVARWLAVLVAAAALVAAGWWAGQAALEPPQNPLVAAQSTVYTVVDGVVSRTLPVSVSATWPTSASVISGAGGVVTSVDTSTDAPVGEGARLVTVDLRPIVVAVGTVPAFRVLGAGAVGPDVAQLQTFLQRTGFNPGRTDGRFDADTTIAVRAWQRSVGFPVTGVVEVGDLVFTPALPSAFRMKVVVGQRVGPGDVLADALAPAPVFTASVTADQLAALPPDAPVAVQGPGVEWLAVVTGVQTDPTTQESVIQLGGEDGGSVCTAACAGVPTTEESIWSGLVTIVAEVSGPVVPVSAIRTAADGTTSVQPVDGESVVVDVLGSSGGLAVVDGVAVGVELDVPTAVND